MTPGYPIYERMRLGFKVQGKNDTKIFILKSSRTTSDGEVIGWAYECEDLKYSIFVYND